MAYMGLSPQRTLDLVNQLRLAGVGLDNLRTGLLGPLGAAGLASHAPELLRTAGEALTTMASGLAGKVEQAETIDQADMIDLAGRSVTFPQSVMPGRPMEFDLDIVTAGNSYSSGEGRGPYNTTGGEVNPIHQTRFAPGLLATYELMLRNMPLSAGSFRFSAGAENDFTTSGVAGTGGPPINLSMVAESGATTASVLGAVRDEIPAEFRPAQSQFEAMAGAPVIMLGISGNDVGFADAVRSALSSRDGTGIQALTDQIPSHIPDWVDLITRVAATMDPSGTLIISGYPHGLPERLPDDQGWGPSALINQVEADRLRQFNIVLNESMQAAISQARAAGALGPAQQITYVENLDAFAGHELWSPNGEAMNGFSVDGSSWQTLVQESYHPTGLGQGLLGHNDYIALEDAAVRHFSTTPPPYDPFRAFAVGDPGPEPPTGIPSRTAFDPFVVFDQPTVSGDPFAGPMQVTPDYSISSDGLSVSFVPDDPPAPYDPFTALVPPVEVTDKSWNDPTVVGDIYVAEDPGLSSTYVPTDLHADDDPFTAYAPTAGFPVTPEVTDGFPDGGGFPANVGDFDGGNAMPFVDTPYSGLDGGYVPYDGYENGYDVGE